MVDLRVLPAADESVRCAAFTRDLAVDPGGTAIAADVVIAVDTPLPWPKPVFDHDALRGVPEMVAVAPQPSRVLAAVPRNAGELRVVAYRRDRTTGVVRRTEWQPGGGRLTATVDALLHDAVPDGAVHVDDEAPVAEIWICTQGSHDTCCGTEGTQLAASVSGRWSDVAVRRVSHTGGHRFAPTAMTLPDGRMWAYLEIDDLEQILRRQGDTAVLSTKCRGWWGAEQGPAQIAERAVFATQGWVWERAPRWTEVVETGREASVIRVRAGEGGLRSWLATVAVRREVPTITCRAPGGLPVKPAQEYEVLDLMSE